jgi:hypothetical protein
MKLYIWIMFILILSLLTIGVAEFNYNLGKLSGGLSCKSNAK